MRFRRARTRRTFRRGSAGRRRGRMRLGRGRRRGVRRLRPGDIGFRL